MDEMTEQIREKIGATHHKIVINRVPKNTFEKFMELASEDEFCQDYGMVLRDMLNVYLDFRELRNVTTIETIAGLSDGVGLLKAEIDNIKLDFVKLSQKQEEKPQEIKVKTTLSGKELR